MPNFVRTSRPMRPAAHKAPNPMKKGVITRRLNGVLYDIMIRTVTDQVYDKNGKSLTETLYDIMQAISGQCKDIDEIISSVREILKDAPEQFNTFKEIYDYVNINGDPKSELISLIDSKESSEHAEEVKDFLLDAINDTKEEFTQKYNALVENIDSIGDTLDEAIVRIEKLEGEPNIVLYQGDVPPDDVKIGDLWYQITSADE